MHRLVLPPKMLWWPMKIMRSGKELGGFTTRGTVAGQMNYLHFSKKSE